MGCEVLRNCAPFTLYLRCDNCMRESTKDIRLPVGEGIPRDADELIESAFLGNRFPGYSFKVVRLGPVGDDDDFCVLPVMNFLGDDGRSYMCTPPKPWLVAEIAAACRGFDVGRRSFAA